MFDNEEGEEVVETPAEETTAEEAPPAWDGSVDTLLTQPWVPEDARPHLEKHLTSHRDALTRRDFLDRVFAEDDRTAALTKELETERAERASLKAALDKATEEVTSYRTKEQDAAADREVQRLRAAYPDIFIEPDEADESKWHRAWEHFYKLTEQGYTEQQAAKMARAFLPEGAVAPAQGAGGDAPVVTPATPAKREVTVPPSVAAAGRSSNNPSVTVNSAEANENFEQRTLRMEREERARAGMR